MATRTEYYRAWYLKNGLARIPEQGLAHQQVAAAIKRGELTRPEVCGCGNSGPIHGHHPDYSKPLEVIWLCRSCHRQLHPGDNPRKLAESGFSPEHEKWLGFVPAEIDLV